MTALLRLRSNGLTLQQAARLNFPRCQLEGQQRWRLRQIMLQRRRAATCCARHDGHERSGCGVM